MFVHFFMSDISHFCGCSQVITGICIRRQCCCDSLLVQFGVHILTLLSGWGLFCLLELARLISNKLTSSKFAQWVFFIQVSNHYIVVIILMNED